MTTSQDPLHYQHLGLDKIHAKTINMKIKSTSLKKMGGKKYPQIEIDNMIPHSCNMIIFS